MDLTVSHFELTNHDLDPENPAANASPAKEAYKKQLARKLFDGEPGGSNSIFSFHGKAPKTSQEDEDTHRVLRSLYVHNRGSTPKKYSRHIPQAPERILDAPELLDDYYLNLLDWGKNNVLAVALGDSVYLWNAADGGIQQLLQTTGEQSHVTSLAWGQEGASHLLAVGTSDHKVQLWDAEKLTLLRSMTGHRARVSSLAWNGPILSSGGRDSLVIQNDTRIAEHRVGTLRRATRPLAARRCPPPPQVLRTALASFPTNRPFVSQGSRAGGLRPQVVAVGHAACLGWQRQLAQYLGRPVHQRGRRDDRPVALPARRAPGGRQGARVVPVAAQPARVGRRHGRPDDSLLERFERRVRPHV